MYDDGYDDDGYDDDGYDGDDVDDDNDDDDDDDDPHHGRMVIVKIDCDKIISITIFYMVTNYLLIIEKESNPFNSIDSIGCKSI